MELNKQLSIVIPTYNRADFLDYSLDVHIPMVKEYNIEICIFDNASTDNTQEVVSKWMKEYKFLSYHKNETNIGPDANFEKALKYPQSDYVWLLGDSSFIEFNSFQSVILCLDNNYDLIVLNNQNRVKNIQSSIITDSNILLKQLGWHMTQMSILVYSKCMLENASFSRYYDTNFIQTGIIFEYLSNKTNISVNWLKECSVNIIKKDGLIKNSWQAQTFEIWIIRWANFILSLPPSYTIENKLYTIRKHHKITNLFAIKNMILLRSQNYFNIEILLRYNKFFFLSLNKYSFLKLLFIALLPQNILKLLVKIVRNAKK